jgi:tetratricopeptide (TPR) repeat protein
VSGIQFVSAFPAAMPESLRNAVDSDEAEGVSARAAAGLLDAEHFSPARVLADRRVHSASFVRLVLDTAIAVRDSSPARALALNDLAIQIADGLPRQEADSSAIALLRAAARRERANALRFLGRHDEALDSLDRAEALLEDVLVCAHEEARIHYCRAGVLALQHRFDEASSCLEISRALFADHGDRARLCDAELLFGVMAFEKHEYAAARERFSVVHRLALELDDPSRIAFAENALGAAEQESGDLTAAAGHFRTAIALYEHLGMSVERARTEWSLGLLSITIGQNADAVRRLRSASDALERSGCSADAALVAIDLAELYVQQQDRPAADRVLASIRRERLPLHAVTAVDLLRRQLEKAQPAHFVETRQQLRLPV